MNAASTDISHFSDVTGVKRVLRNAENPLPFVKNLVQQSHHRISEIELMVQNVIDETDSSMKLAVYKNYQLFIEAAKEVGLLEAEMQVMTNMLKDQRQLLESLTDFRLSDVASRPLNDLGKGAASAGDSRKALSYILERVEGSSDVADVPNREMLHHCDCTELDAASMAPCGQFRLFLLNDAVLLASVSDSEQGKCYLQDLIELDNAAFVGFSPQSDPQQQQHAEVANIFKLLVFPDTRVFALGSADEAAALLERVRAAKLEKAIADSAKRPSSLLSRVGATDKDADVAWFEDKPDDLDVLIAERRFTKVVDLLTECYHRLEARSDLKVMKARIDSRKNVVIKQLLKELQTPPHVSLRGGPKASRKAVKQLLRLGKTMEAAEQYLQLRSSIREHLVGQVKQEDSQALFAKRISAAFFKTFVESLHEFQLIGFGKEAGSLLLKWCRSEVGQLVERISSVLAEGSATFAEFAAGWWAAKVNARQVADGERVQATFMLEEACLPKWQAAIEKQAKNLTAAATARAAEEKWIVLKRSTHKEADEFFTFLRQLQPELTKKAMSQTQQYDISSMTYVFSNSFLKFADSLAKLYSHELHHVISDALAAVLSRELQDYRRCLSAAQLLDKRDFILHNLRFIQSLLLATTNTKLQNASGLPSEKFDSYHQAQQELAAIIEASTPAVV